MSDDDTVADATAAIDPPSIEVVYAWQEEQPGEERVAHLGPSATSRSVVAVAALSATALAIAAVAAVVVLVAPAPAAPASHYVIRSAPIEQAPVPPAPKAAPKPTPQPQPQPAARLPHLPAARHWTPQPTPAPQPSVAPLAAPSPVFDPAGDQWLLNNLRSLGFTIINPPLVIHNAHEACRLLQQGESTEQMNQQMMAQTGANMNDVLQLTSSAMLAYPNCY